MKGCGIGAQKVAAQLHTWVKIFRNRAAGGVQVAFLAGSLVLGCSGVPPHPNVDGVDEQFSGALSQAHLESMTRVGARPVSSRAERRARAYLQRELEALGARVDEIEDPAGQHLIADLPGASPDRVVLIVPMSHSELEPTPRDDSGVALLTELARVLSLQVLPYTVRLVYADPGANGLEEASRLVSGDPAGSAGRTRLIVIFDLHATGDLRLARDLRSHPVYRDIFWESASALGFESVFPTNGDWSSPDGLHDAFLARDMNLVVALIDERKAHPDIDSGDPAEPASAETLEVVGTVSIEALSRIMRRLEKIDAFRR